MPCDQSFGVTLNRLLQNVTYRRPSLNGGTTGIEHYLLRDFIPHAALTEIWSKENIKRFLSPSDLTDIRLRNIQMHCLKLLSILLQIQDWECLDSFVVLTTKPDGDTKWQDTELPLGRASIGSSGFASGKEDLFEQTQWRYLAPEIREGKDISLVDVTQPFPFLSVDMEALVGQGGFGTVYPVRIARGHLLDASGEIMGGEVFALKIFNCKPDHDRALNAAEREVENLKILKDSVSTNKNIMFHIAVLRRELDIFILSRFARLGNLRTFLYNGYEDNVASDARLIYRFKEFFPNLDPENRAVHVLTQAHALAAALKWLHGGLDTLQGTYYFAHMDLNPQNIVIDIDGQCNSLVGIWKLVDFGISAFRKDRAAPNRPSMRTMQTPPKRQISTYCAPEIHLFWARHGIQDIHEAVHQGVGRKSDIWSFGCILALLFAYIIGGHEKITEFDEYRKFKIESDVIRDHFARKTYGNNLRETNFALNPQVREWLGKQTPQVGVLPKFQSRWAECCVKTILSLLRQDPEKRPDHNALESMMKELYYHYSHMDGRETESTCPNLSEQGTAPREAEPSNAARNLPRRDHPISPEIVIDTNELSRQPSRVDQSVMLNRHSDLGTPSELYPAEHESGIIARSNPLREQRHKFSEPLGNSVKESITSISICPNTQNVAVLASNTVYKFDVNYTERTVSKPVKIALVEGDATWKGIQFANPYIVAWGSSKIGQKIRLEYIGLPRRTVSCPIDCARFQTVHLSSSGILALVFKREIIGLHIESQSTCFEFKEVNDQESFELGAFSADASYFYALTRPNGGNNDRLYTWKISEGKTFTLEHHTDYTANKESKNIMNLYPMETFQGCVVGEMKQELPEDSQSKFFPSQKRGSQTKDVNVSARKVIHIDRLHCCTVFNSSSFVTIERLKKSLFWQRDKYVVREYEIVQGDTRSISETNCKDIYEFENALHGKIRMLVSPAQANQVNLVICDEKEVRVFQFG